MPKHKTKAKKKAKAKTKAKTKTKSPSILKNDEYIVGSRYNADGEHLCQAYTDSGNLCSRKAYIKVDLTKDMKLFGKTMPKADCCMFCKQHSLIMAVNYGSYAMYQLVEYLATRKMRIDEYYALFPDRAYGLLK